VKAAEEFFFLNRHRSAEEFLETLVKLIAEGNYLPEQIFSMDKTSLFWK
jgi:hypothetical protein